MRLDPRNSYGGKVLVGFLIVVVVGGSVGAVLVTGIQDEIRTDKRNTLAAESDLQEDTVSTLLRDLRGRTQSLAGTVDSVRGQAGMSESATQALRQSFVRQAARSNATGRILLVDGESGQIEIATDGDVQGMSASTLGYQLPSEFENGETVVRLSTAGGDRAWVVFAKTATGDVVVHTTPLSFVQNELEGVLDDTRTRVVNGQGEVVYDSANPNFVGSQHIGGAGVDSPAVETGLANPGAAATLRLSPEESSLGETTLSSYDKVDGADWVVVSYGRPGALFSTVNLVWRDLLVLLTLVGVLLGGYALVVERPAARRMASLGVEVRRLRDGELDTEIERTRGDELGDLAEGLDTMRRNLKTEIDRAQSAREDAESAREEAEALSEHLTTKADAYAAALERLADGDFTTRVDPESDHEGMAQMGETLNDVVGDLESTLGAVQRFADDVAASMEELAASADEIEDAAADVSDTVGEITADADDQRDRLQSVGDEMEDLSATVEEVAATMTEVADNAERAGQYRREGREAAEDASEALEEIKAETDEAVGAVEELVEQVADIGEFADVIADVADQTNMLALNANVEAARTDTDGDGFAVVADEIKQLAEEAGDRADDIESLIEDIEAQSERTVERMRAASDQLETSNDTVERAIETFYDIDEVVAEVNDGIQDVTRATEDQATTTEEVAATVDEVTAIAERTAAEAEDVASAAEQQTTATGQVSRTAEQLAADAGDLSNTVAQFEVAPDRDGDAEGSASETTADGTAEDPADADPPAPQGDGEVRAPDGGDPDANSADGETGE
ncbi:methyl-accepting chemotaxis protein [Halobaculum sp. MBLA0147]|uniref:methyl-accepting chemotaxis protein n=1 Tax=Halobaculum sp. MBLA0147 TaxID=3079934 RepID=UPI003524C5B9